MEEGGFRYNLDKVKIMTIGKYVANFNPMRATKRLIHENVDRHRISVHKPFNPKGFHFLKIKPHEILFVFTGTALKPFENFEKLKESEHLIIINVNPVGSGHSLVVPFAKKHYNQFMRTDGLKVGLQFLKNSGPNVRMLFNSIGAFGSVNHFHFQPYYTKVPEAAENVEIIPTHKNNLFTTCGWPVRGFCVTYEDIDEAAALVMPLIELFQKRDIGHNMLLTKTKIFIFPKVNELSGHDFMTIGIASMECSGHFIITDKNNLKRSEGELSKLAATYSLGKNDIKELLAQAFPN